MNQTEADTNTDWPGSRWWRFDFHTHTPASKDYRGDKAITPRDWLLSFMRAGIDCVAVTDHNSGAWVDQLKEVLDAWRDNSGDRPTDYRPLTLFPGIELSVNGGVHLLALFDPSKGAAEVEALRGAVGYRGTSGDSDAVTQNSLEACIEKALEHHAIPIPAHVDGKKGLLGSITDHHTRQSVLSKLIAVEVCDTDSECFRSAGDALSGLSWVVGSDSHAPDKVGKYTWIKMSKPDIEGLRLALLDGESAVRRQEDAQDNPNATAVQRITQLRIEKLKLRRHEPLTVRFNPWFNAIIGGRGSGKSTLLECLRIGLNRSDELDMFAGLRESFQRFRKISAGRDEDGVFLESSDITVEYLKDGVRNRMHWRADEPAPIQLTQETNGDWRAAGQVFPDRFPVRIYSQKQVFEMAKNPHSLRRLMDDDPDLDKLGWRRRWDELEDRFMRQRAEHRRLGRELIERERFEGELRDVQLKLRVFEQSDHAAVFKDFQRSQRQQTVVKRHLDGLREQLTAWRGALDDPQAADFSFDPQGRFDSNDPNQQALLALFENLAQDLTARHESLRTGLAAMQMRLQQARDAVDAGDWQAAARAHRQSYERLKAKLEQQGIADPNVYGQLVQQRQLLESRLRDLVEKQQRFDALWRQCQETYDEIETWRLELTKRRRCFVDRVLGQNRHVQVQLQPFGDQKRAEADFRKLIIKEGVVYADDILSEDRKQGFFHDLYVTESGRDDLDGVPDRIRTFKGELDTLGGESLLYTTVKKPFFKHLESIREKTPEVLDRLWCWFPEDAVRVCYQAPESDGFRPIDRASAGQKTSAILSFLLAYGEEPLVLDQPEDDLDNALIYELIVKQIRENKTRRQIIVVTHNPNIVVHGDAEWVLPLQIANGSIQQNHAGGLQEVAVRQAVCDIMEGGVEAFEQRYRKIHDQVSGR